MLRTALVGLLALQSVAAQALPDSGRPAPAPAFPTPPQSDSVERIPFFRPKVVMRREIILPKDPFLGGALSLVLPGTGQAYCGRWGKAVAFLAGSFVCYTLAGAVGNSQNLTTEARSVGSGLFLLLGMGAHTWSVIDGVNTANAHNRMLLGSP